MAAARLVKSLIVLLGAALQLFAAEFSARVVDNLGNPVIGVRIAANCSESRSDGRHGPLRGLFNFRSGPNGIVSGTYKPPKNGCETTSLFLEKEGYGGAHYDSLRPVYVIPRKVHADDLHRIAQLSGADLNVALRGMLTSDVEGPFQDLVFYYEDRLRPALRSLVEDPEAGILEPSSEAEWSLLRASALGEYKDGRVTRGAIQSLKLIASLRSREILEEVRRDNSFGAKLTPRAIEYIQSNPPPLRDQDLEELGHRVAQALGIRTWTGNGTSKYNQAGDKALILLNFDAGSDVYVYTAAFQRADGTWVLRGVRESMQGYKGPDPSVVTALRRKTK